MTRSQKYNLVTNILQRFKEAGLMMGEKTHVHWLAKIGASCYIIAYTLMIISFTINIHQNLENSFDRVRDLSIFSIGILKLISLRKNRDAWYFLLNEAANIEKEQVKLQLKYKCDNQDDAFDFSKYIRVYSERFQKISKFLLTTYKTTFVVFSFSPYIEYGYSKFYGSGTDGWPHILSCWSPLDDYNFADYILTTIIQVLGTIYCVYIHTVFDITSIGIMMFSTGQFILLRNYSENIGSKKDVSITKKRDDQAHLCIKICHNFHVRLTNLTAELRALLKNILGVYIFTASLHICASAVKFISDINTTCIELVSVVQNLSCTLIQLFMFCYYGDNLLNESAIGQGEGPYGAAYWAVSPRIRKELLILAMGMSRPCQLYAGPFIPVNLPTYIQVLRTAYSYYAFMKGRQE